MKVSTAAPSAGEISARIDRLPATRTIWTAILLLSFGMFFELYDLLFSGYIAPSLVKTGLFTQTPGLFDRIQIVVWRALDLPPPAPDQFGLTGVAGFIAALFTGLFIGTILCGFLADRFGRRTIFTFSLLWYTAATIDGGAPDTSVRTRSSGVSSPASASASSWSPSTPTSPNWCPRQMRGHAFACTQVIGFCGVPVMAFLAYAPRARSRRSGLDGWRWVVLIGALAAVLIGFLRFGVPESPRWLARQGPHRGGRPGSARYRGAGRRRKRPPAAARRTRGAGRRSAGSFGDLWVPPVRRRVILMSVFNLFQTVGFYGFSNWVPSLLVKQGIAMSTSLGYTFVIALAAPVGPLLGVLHRDRIERKWMIIVAAAGAVLVCGLIFGADARRPR